MLYLIHRALKIQYGEACNRNTGKRHHHLTEEKLAKKLLEKVGANLKSIKTIETKPVTYQMGKYLKQIHVSKQGKNFLKLNTLSVHTL